MPCILRPCSRSGVSSRADEYRLRIPGAYGFLPDLLRERPPPFLSHRFHFLSLRFLHPHGCARQPRLLQSVLIRRSSHIPVLCPHQSKRFPQAWKNSIFEWLPQLLIRWQTSGCLHLKTVWSEFRPDPGRRLRCHILYRRRIPSVPGLPLLCRRGCRYKLCRLP